jgi:hypothetical protein
LDPIPSVHLDGAPVRPYLLATGKAGTAMLRKLLFPALAALLVTLVMSSEARAWGCYRYGYRYGGFGGYHYGVYGGFGGYGGIYRYGYYRRW